MDLINLLRILFTEYVPHHSAFASNSNQATDVGLPLRGRLGYQLTERNCKNPICQTPVLGPRLYSSVHLAVS